MLTRQVVVNGTRFRLMLTDQMIGHVNNLKALYSASYEDPESFEEVSSEISATIREIASSVEPEASDGDLDGLIQEIIRVVDGNAAELEKEMVGHEEAAKKSRKR